MEVGKGQFKRRLNLLDMTFLGCGTIIGSGWLYGAMNGAKIAGPYAWISWVIGAVISMLIGLVYAELSSAMPRSGGFLRYPDYSHGTMVGYLISFAALLGYTSVIGVEVEAVRQYASSYLPALNAGDTSHPSLLGFLVQSALIALFFLINYWSVHFFGKVNTVWTFFKIIVPVLAIVFLFMSMHPGNFSVGGAAPGGIDGIFKAIVGAGIAFAFFGFRQPVDFAGEARNPQKTVPIAVILSIVICLALYLLLQIAFIGAVPGNVIAGGWNSIDWTSPWAKLSEILGLVWLQYLILIDSAVSPAGTGNIFLSGTARMMFAWAKNGYFYSIFAKVDRRTGIPRCALWLALIMGILWTLPEQFQTWSGLISAVTSAFVLTYMMGPVSAMAFRKNNPDMERPFQLKGMSWIAPLTFIAASLVAYWAGWNVLILLIPLVVGSLVLYFAFVDKEKRFRTTLREDFMAAIWLFVYYAFILAISWFGSFGPGKVIPAPWDTIVAAVGALIFFYWGVASALRESRITRDEEDVG